MTEFIPVAKMALAVFKFTSAWHWLKLIPVLATLLFKIVAERSAQDYHGFLE